VAAGVDDGLQVAGADPFVAADQGVAGLRLDVEALHRVFGISLANGAIDVDARRGRRRRQDPAPGRRLVARRADERAQRGQRELSAGRGAVVDDRDRNQRQARE